MSKDNKDLIVGLDVGTSKVTAMVAELRPDGRIDVIGVATQASAGLKKGVVVNIEATVDAISRVVQEVELLADCKVRDVYTGIAGSHIRSFNSNGMVAIKDKEVTPLDVERVIEVARAMPIPADQQILHILTQEFIIDGQDGVREPIGMSGVKLEVRVHIITGAVSAAQNLIKCVRRCGLEVVDLVLQPLASSFATLSDDEKELGVCLVDIGGGTTDLAVFTQGAIRHTAVIPIAGDQITNDIAMALRTPTIEAEEIKLHQGVAMQSLVDPAEMIEVPSIGDRAPRRLSRESLAAVVQPRVQELFELVQAELRRSGYEELLSSGLVMSGGSARLAGICELGEDVFHLPVRVGTPFYQGPLADVVCQPQYANVMGLIMEGAAQRRRGLMARETRNVRHTFERIKAWFEKNF
ncbi:MAG: cell division protein FtsA [Uliginosibacterium sp.]|jgi:cell division protein FtsA|nr:cell division protein FtsA [Uliginosibacterium sp.]MBK9394530.1 cell division protein FtsA [Uliginosibacterium sp.]MBK9616418.1 cell division protein FtsA [Uliginosibacterium sp.]